MRGCSYVYLPQLHPMGLVSREDPTEGLGRVVGEVLGAEDADEEAMAQVVVQWRDAARAAEPHAALGNVEAVRTHQRLERLKHHLLAQAVL